MTKSYSRKTLDPETKAEVLSLLEISPDAEGETPCCCPFHDDTNASAVYNPQKGLLWCHACHRGWNDFQLKKELIDDGAVETGADSGGERRGLGTGNAGVADTPAFVGPEPDGATYLAERGISTDHIPGWHVRNGYLYFDEGERVGRNLIDDDRPRYSNAKGNKSLYWIGREREAGDRTVWLTEGVIDGLSLKELLPHHCIAAGLGSSLSDAQAYELRDSTVFVVYDADHAGFRGARKVQELLREFNANAIILDFPSELGNDLNEAWVKHPDELRRWINDQRAEYATTDDLYVHRLFRENTEPLLTIPSGSQQWDHLLKGGFRPGLHILGAESGVGKSSWAVGFSVQSAFDGWRVLYVTNEIPKRQVWARIAATQNGMSWAEIEADPLQVSEEVTKRLEQLGQKLRVVSGWTIPRIKYVADHYDVIVVDYLQRVSTRFGQDANKAAMDYVSQELSDLGRDNGKVVIGISSVNRAGYGGEFKKGDLKESGGLEFVAQSVTGMTRGSGGLVQMSVVKNTRGLEKVFWLNADLEHQRFTDAQALSSNVLPRQKQQSKIEGVIKQ